MSYISGHAGSGSPLDFGSAAAEDLQGTRVEGKYCELCSRMYFRRSSIYARRECDRCIARMDRQRAEHAAAQRIAAK
jgi:hypothetical protein